MENECAGRHAATGLAAAWLYAHFTTFRTLVVYVDCPSPDKILAPIGFQTGERGANLWLVTPNDDSVLEGAEYREGVRCTSAVQTYLDLKDAGERSEEASAGMKRYFLETVSIGG